jgi:hypothetical protein
MRTLLLAVLVLIASAGIVPAQTKSPGPLDLEYKQRAPALRPVPPRKLEEDTTQAVRELDRQRTDRMLREVQPGPSRRPDLDLDVTQGIQTRGLGR